MEGSSNPPPTRFRQLVDLICCLIWEIFKWLPLSDHIRGAAVCKEMRELILPNNGVHQLEPHPLPWLIPVNIGEPVQDQELASSSTIIFYSPLEDTYYSFEIPRRNFVFRSSPHGFLLLVECDQFPPFSLGSSFILLNPISRTRIDLPSLSSASSICVSSRDLNDCIIMINGKQNSADSLFLLWRVGDPLEWTPVPRPNGESALSLTFCRGKFFGNTFYRHLYVIDPLIHTIRKVTMKAGEGWSLSSDIDLLVECTGEVFLILVIADVNKTFTVERFEVFRADMSMEGWVRVDDLGDQVLFIADQQSSISLLADNVTGGRNNVIFFPQTLLECHEEELGPREEYVLLKGYDLKAGTIFDGPHLPIIENYHRSIFLKYPVRWFVPRP